MLMILFLMKGAYRIYCKELYQSLYGFNPILRPFVKEISELESISRMKLQTNFSIQDCLTIVVADTGSSSSFRILKSFS